MTIAELLTQLSRTFVEVSLFYHPLAWRKPDEVEKKCVLLSVNRDEVGSKNISSVMRKWTLMQMNRLFLL
jgi:hypothetical protein